MTIKVINFFKELHLKKQQVDTSNKINANVYEYVVVI